METLIAVPFVIGIIAIILLLISALLQWLWNMTIPEVFGLKSISYWQSFRIMIIAGILFTGSPNDEVRKIRVAVDDINKKLEILVKE